MKEKMKRGILLLPVLILFSGISTAFALTHEERDEKIRRLEERMEVLYNEINELKTQQADLQEKTEETEVIKDEVRKLKLDIAIPKVEYKTYSGLGPAASKVYFVPRGLSIGGYGEINYEAFLAKRKKTIKFAL